MTIIIPCFWETNAINLALALKGVNMKKGMLILGVIAFWLVATGLAPSLAQARSIRIRNDTPSWVVSQNGNLLQINYGSGSSFPQYGVIDLQSSYFRLNPGPPSGWGTSVVLLPSFWSQQACPPPGLCQGAPVQATWQTDQTGALVFSLTGTIGSLQVALAVRITPPANNQISAWVSERVDGTVPLDSRPGEAYKPLMLSSMHVSSTLWDTQAAYVEYQSFSLPDASWIIQPPARGKFFGLQGGTSDWKTNAPTIQVLLSNPVRRNGPVTPPLQITGFVTSSSDPNDDNIGFWPASDQILHAFSYVVTAAPASALPT
jgi:hypothetical protein